MKMLMRLLVLVALLCFVRAPSTGITAFPEETIRGGEADDRGDTLVEYHCKATLARCLRRSPVPLPALVLGIALPRLSALPRPLPRAHELEQAPPVPLPLIV